MLKYEVKNGLTTLHTEFYELPISPDREKGIKPSELLVSSLVGCSSAIFTKVLEKKRITVDSIRVEASMERNPNEANRITKIALHFIIEGKNISADKIKKSLEVTTKNCGMIQSVKGSIEVTETFEIIES